MGKAERAFAATAVVQALIGVIDMLALVMLMDLFRSFSGSNSLLSPYFTVASVFPIISYVVLMTMTSSGIYDTLHDTINPKEVKPTPFPKVAAGYKHYLAFIGTYTRGCMFFVSKFVGAGAIAVFMVCGNAIALSLLQLRYGSKGAPSKTSAKIGAALCVVAMTIYAFMLPIDFYGETIRSHHIIDKDVRARVLLLQFAATSAIGTVSRHVIAARINKSASNPSQMTTPSALILVSADKEVLFAPLCLAVDIWLNMGWKSIAADGFLGLYRASRTVPLRLMSNPFLYQDICAMSLVVGLVIVLKMLIETKELGNFKIGISYFFFYASMIAYMCWVFVLEALHRRRMDENIKAQKHVMQLFNFGFRDWGYYAVPLSGIGISMLLSGFPNIGELEIGKVETKDYVAAESEEIDEIAPASTVDDD